MKILLYFLVFLIITMDVSASLDITDLYLRKIKGVEFTFLGKDGWTKSKRNKFEFFYETDYLMNAGTNNPKLIDPSDNTDKDPLAISDWGFFIDITSDKNPIDIIFFNFSSKTMMVDPDHNNYYLTTIALAFPEVVAYENTYIRQSITGLSLNYKNYLYFSYGIILDERAESDNYNGFYELNLPFLHNSLVRNIENNEIERFESVLHYDKFNFKLGFRYKDSIFSRKHYYLKSNIYQSDKFYLNLGTTLNENLKLASLESSIVLHSSKEDTGDNKFGSAYFITGSLFLTNPQRNNIWGKAYGNNDFYTGGKLEFSFQAPLLAWGGIFFAIFVAPFAVLDEEGDALEAVMDVSGAMIEGSDESDKSFGIFTFGFDYNNPDLLKEIPNAISNWHIYVKFRVMY